jgi:hypothetical protein
LRGLAANCIVVSIDHIVHTHWTQVIVLIEQHGSSSFVSIAFHGMMARIHGALSAHYP